ncbi:Mu transposase C-terminal domain-containing protein [Streptomyces europaeiscabiei]|uniref:Mu transposase C-terminal domain-containing protein n=1 Tax=Streptomyces europaeiscabiei TaxID=146819 RepID=UPI0029AC2120|nr:Mu transposase C-terminal domain-containing protein [Streptomyces europaeiscabiei]MDX2757255.1 Mu transposase C-terminal domain-containing protein [Streptomyces europaeiscabiei]
MSRAAVRVGVGSRFSYDGEIVEAVELASTQAGGEVVLKDGRGRLLRLAVKELLLSDRVRIIPDGPGPASDDPQETAAVVLARLNAGERELVLERAAHVREVLTGFRSGSKELAAVGEPRAAYTASEPLESRYAAKAAELGVAARTVKRWAAAFRQDGEAGLVPARSGPRSGHRNAEPWSEAALEVMVEHTGQSKPSRKMVIERTRARLLARGFEEEDLPSRATAYRLLEDLERRHPTFRLSTKRNRDIAARPGGVYGKLRPTRPGEYLLMDTNRLDVFALDPVTLQWLQAELTVAMDWYTRCVCGIRITPVSTKAVDASVALYQAFRPRPSGADWPAHAVWPEHGIPRSVLVEATALEGPMRSAASPALVPETVLVDHGKVFVSEHLTSVCRRLGISVQPARLRTGRDKGPLERFFLTLREDLLQGLPGYKGPDLHSRGERPEGEAFFFLHELEAIIREWVACVYHVRPHTSLIDPGVPGLRMSPAAMFEHGLNRAGYIEVPRDPDLAFEFLRVERRKIQHYGIDLDARRYNGAALDPYRGLLSDEKDGKWPIAVNPDDINTVYFRDPADRRWHALAWEHTPGRDMPVSEEALQFARRLAAARDRFPDDKAAVRDLFERWNLGLGTSLVERRMALRLAREQAALDLPEAEESVATLPSVRRLMELPDAAEPHLAAEAVQEIGDDDVAEDAELEDDSDFYTDALEDA